MTIARPLSERSRAKTWALWLAIGALVGSALLGGFFIIVGDQSASAGRAWLTLILVAAFAGAVLLDASVSHGPNQWYLPASVVVNVLIVLIGLLKLWNGPLQPADTDDGLVWIGQLFRLIAVIVLVRLALLITQLYGLRFVTKARTTITRVSAVVALVFAWSCVLFLAVPAAFPQSEWPDWWWRASGATALVAVVLAVVPLIVWAFEPRQPQRQQEAYGMPHGHAFPVQGGHTSAYSGQQQGPMPSHYPAQPQYPAQPRYAPQPQYPAQEQDPRQSAASAAPGDPEASFVSPT